MVEYLDKVGLIYLWNKVKAKFATKAELALKQDSLTFNATNGTSGTAAVTASPFTSSIWRVDLSDKVTELYTGLTILLKIPVAGNDTYGTLLRIDGVNVVGDSDSNLYPVCSNVNSMIGTRYVVDSIIALTFDADQYGQKLYYNSKSAITTTASGTGWAKKGCWKIADYDTNTNNTLRTNTSTLPVSGVTYRYRLLFTSVDGNNWIPANTSTSTSHSSKKDVNQTPINPFGPIVYYSSTIALSVGERVPTAYQNQQKTINLGYSFNRTGAELTLDVDKPVYIKAAPQSDGSAIIDANTPYVQTLPTTEDGNIYIFLGITYAAIGIELRLEHPVYYFKDGAIRLWTNNVVPSTITNAEMDNVLEETT